MPDMRRSIDQIRDYLFGCGYPAPVSNLRQRIVEEVAGIGAPYAA